MKTCIYCYGKENDDWNDVFDNFPTEKYTSLPKPVLINDLYESKHYASFLDMINSPTLMKRVESEILKNEKSEAVDSTLDQTHCGFYKNWKFFSKADINRHSYFLIFVLNMYDV